MRYAFIGCMVFLTSAVVPAQAQISIYFGSPTFQIGIDMPVYPELERVPGYPVYYDPRAEGNYFFYDGLYWVYAEDNWYESEWYNGPWRNVDPQYVPLYVLRVPVRYYRRPPSYFQGWGADSPPRWGEHWGRDWEGRHAGWDRWNRGSAPQPAPLPSYQRRYSGGTYPRAEQQQRSIRQESYHYQPREAVSRQHVQQAGGGGARQPDRAQQQQRSVQQERSQQQQRQQPQQQPQQQQERARQAPPQQQDKGRDNKDSNKGDRGGA